MKKQFTTSYRDDSSKVEELKQQSTAEILLLPVSENKSPACWNSASGFDFHVCVTIGMSFWICLPNFVQIGPSTVELWRHIHFPRWWTRHPNSTFGFVFVSSLIWKVRIYLQTKFRRDISIHGWDITTSVCENKRPPCWNSTSGFDFYICVIIGVSFWVYLPNFVQIGPSTVELWRHSFSRWQPSAILKFFKGNCRPPTKCKWGSQVSPVILTRSDL